MSSTFWFDWAFRLSVLVLLMAGLLGVVRYRSLPVELQYLVMLIGFGLAVEMVANVLLYSNKPNLWLFPVDAAGELWLLSLVYARSLQSTRFAQARPWLAGSFVLYAALSLGANFGIIGFLPAVQVLESLLVLSLAGLYFRKLLNELQVLQLARDPMFWVSAGLAVYSISKLLIALFSNYMLAHYSKQLNQSVWTIHGLLTIVLYLCYLRALWLRPQK